MVLASLADDAFWVLGGPRPTGVVTQMADWWARLRCRVGWHRMDRTVVSYLPTGLLGCSRGGCRQYRIREEDAD